MLTSIVSVVRGEEGFIRLYRGPQESCGIDLDPTDGSGCSGDKTPTKTCGTCGIWCVVFNVSGICVLLQDSKYYIEFYSGLITVTQSVSNC